MTQLEYLKVLIWNAIFHWFFSKSYFSYCKLCTKYIFNIMKHQKWFSYLLSSLCLYFFEVLFYFNFLASNYNDLHKRILLLLGICKLETNNNLRWLSKMQIIYRVKDRIYSSKPYMNKVCNISTDLLYNPQSPI
jgi:hypothetical protein